MECSICCEIHKSNKICPHCNNNNQVICKGCIKKYLYSNINNLSCMLCKKGWTLRLIRDLLGYRVVNKIHDKRFEIALKREYTRLDNEKVNLYKLKEVEAKKKLINETREEMRDLKKLFEDNVTTNPQSSLQKFMLYQEKQRLIKTLKFEILKIQNKDGILKSVPSFILKCPKRKCDGVIDPDSETCVKCYIDVCMICGKKIPYSDIHICDEEDIQTVKMLKENTKNCPKCASCIFRAEGCTQMFCTICHTAFDWLTMCIITNGIHNPHYYELVRKGGLKSKFNTNIDTNTIDGLYFNHLDHLYPKNYPTRLFSISAVAHDNVNAEREAMIRQHEIILRKFREKMLLGSITTKIFDNKIRQLELKHELNMLRISHRLAVKNVAEKCLDEVVSILRDDMIKRVYNDDKSGYLYREFIKGVEKGENINIFKEYLEIAMIKLDKMSKEIIRLIYEYKENADIYSSINKNYNEFESFINDYNRPDDSDEE